MAKKNNTAKAFVKEIKMNSYDSHQTSPGMMLTCLRWGVRDTVNYPGDPLGTRDPMIVYNDMITCTVANTKVGLTPQLNVELKAGDINYATALHPGDFVILNMVNDNHKISKGNSSDNTLRSRASQSASGGIQAMNNNEYTLIKKRLFHKQSNIWIYVI